MHINPLSQSSKYSMRQKLFEYMLMLAALLIAALLAAFILFGRFDSEQRDTFEKLDIQMEFLDKNVSTHFDRLAGSSIRLSRDTSAIIDEYLSQSSLSFHDLSDNAQAISLLQSAIIEPLRQQLLQSNCSGAFVLLDVTVNQSLHNAEYSRSGLYLQRSGFYNSDDSVVLYRGDSQVGKEHGIFPHRKWRLEFRCDMIPDYEQMVASAALPLSESYRFTDVTALPGTSDLAMMLVIPLVGSDGTFYGLCGFEISENYFMTYHAQPTYISSLMCLLVSGEGKTLDADASLSCGGSNGFYLAPSGLLTASRQSGKLTVFAADRTSYIGLTRTLSLSPNNSNYTLAVMIPKADYDRAVNKSILQNVIMWALLIFFGVSCCLYFSRRYLSPILKALSELKSQDRSHAQTNVLEMDDLISFLSAQDSEQKRAVSILEKSRTSALREKKRLQRECEAAQLKYAEIQSNYEDAQNRYEAIQNQYEAAQKEISRLAYSRSQEVDPDEYAQFLAGIELLTVSEMKVFNYYLEGKSVKDIIELLHIKESTLRFHNRNIYSKLGVTSLKQLLRYASLMQQTRREDE